MKALLFNVNVAKFLAIQALRPVSASFCYSGPFATFRPADIPEPALPSPEWVKIKTKLCGVCGSDINLIMLKDSPTASPFTSFPCVPGHEFCGEIVETGNLRYLTSLREELPEGVQYLTRLEGIGPKKAIALSRDLGIRTVDDLEAAAKALQWGKRVYLFSPRPVDERDHTGGEARELYGRLRDMGAVECGEKEELLEMLTREGGEG